MIDRVSLAVLVMFLVGGLALAETWQRTSTRVADTGDTWRHEEWLTVAGDRTVLVTSLYNESTGIVVERSFAGATGTVEVETAAEFQPVSDALPDSMVGTWRIDDLFGNTFLLRIGTDGSFELVVYEFGNRYVRLTATGAVVDLEHYVVHLSDLTEAKWIDGAWNDADWHGPWEGSGSFRFVPYHRGIVVSPPWDERNPEMPHGYYGMYFERVG